MEDKIKKALYVFFVPLPDNMYLVPFNIPCCTNVKAFKTPRPIVPEVEYNLKHQVTSYPGVDMDNIVQSLNETGSSYLIAQCAYGKTIMFFYLLMLLKQRTIICIRNDNIDATNI